MIPASQIKIGCLVDAGEAHVQTGPFGTQLKASDYVVDGTPVINVRNIGYGDLRPEKIEFVPQEVCERLSVHILQPNDIVFGRKGAVDRHLFVTTKQEGWMQGSDCIRLRFLSEKIDARFVSYAFLTTNHQDWMLLQGGNKATMASLNQDIISRIEIPDLPVEKQRRIASILSAYDALIENNRRRMALLEEAARKLYREWFIRLRFPGHEHTPVRDGLPEGWERKTLGDLCDAIRDIASPDQIDADTPYIGLEHIPRRSISQAEWGRADAVTSSKHKFSAGDILFGKIRPYFHKVSLALVDGVASADAIVIRPNEAYLHSLVLMTVSSDAFVAMAAQTMKEGSKMPRADWKQMQAHGVLRPPLPVLEAFNRQIVPITEQLRNLTFQTRKLRAARDLLLPKLMHRKIEV